MIEADGIDRHEAAKVIGVGRQVAVPGDDIEGRMVQLRGPKTALKLLDQFKGLIPVLEPGLRALEIARIGQAVSADRTELRKPEHGPIVFTDIPPGGRVQQDHREANAARDHGDLQGLKVDQPKLGDEPQPALLGHDQQLAIGIEEGPVLHGPVGGVKMNAEPGARRHIAITGDGCQAIDKIGRRVRQRRRIPAQPIWRRRRLVERSRTQAPRHRIRNEGAVIGRRPQPVQPGPTVLGPWRREGRAGQLLGIEIEGRVLRRVAAHRQGAGDGLGLEVAAEAGQRRTNDIQAGADAPSNSHVTSSRAAFMR